MAEHVFKNRVCTKCAMNADWGGAKDSCTRAGAPKQSSDQHKQYLARKYQARKAANA